jgi:hypothetical protein
MRCLQRNTALSYPSLREGYLLKPGKTIALLTHKRFYQLRFASLYYFADEAARAAEEPRGVIDLACVTSVQLLAPFNDFNFPFKVLTVDRERTFGAASDADRKAWISAVEESRKWLRELNDAIAFGRAYVEASEDPPPPTVVASPVSRLSTARPPPRRAAAGAEGSTSGGGRLDSSRLRSRAEDKRMTVWGGGWS